MTIPASSNARAPSAFVLRSVPLLALPCPFLPAWRQSFPSKPARHQSARGVLDETREDVSAETDIKLGAA
jgi:hypothetical protein